MSDPVKSRPYTSPLRQGRAEATRRRILEAGTGLFLEHGYAGTTMKAVAATAQVAVDTVFHRFSTKRDLLKAAVDAVIAGDAEDRPVLAREGPQALRAETDQSRQIELLARGISNQVERIAPVDAMLRSAAAVDAEIAALRDDIQLRQRREAMRTVAGWIADRGPLRDGLLPDQAADILWTLTGPDVHRLLRVECGWAADAYRSWLERSLRDALLDPGAT